MTDNEGTPPEAAIIEQIIGDAETQAKRLVDNAALGVTAEEKKTEREVAKFEQDVRAGWEDRIEKIRMREISTAKIESRRILLNAREQAVAAVFDEIAAGLGHLREDPGRYRQSLSSLAAEAVRAIGGDEVVLRISERDSGIADDDFIAGVRESAGMTSGRTHVRVEFEAEDTAGGCIAASADGRVVFDNTYGRRLERLRSDIRTSIVRELEKANE